MSTEHPVEEATAAPGEKRATRDTTPIKVWHLIDRRGRVHRTYHTEAEALQALGSGGYFSLRVDEL